MHPELSFHVTGSNTLIYSEKITQFMLKGIVDRIEDETYAVIVFSSEESQIVCEVENLPEEARHSGAVIEFEVENDSISKVNYLLGEEESNKERINRKRDEATKD